MKASYGKERAILEIVGGTDKSDGSPPGGGEGGHDDDGPRPIWCNEDALAAELVKDLGHDWHYASSGEWGRWDGKRWETEKLKRVWHRSRRVCRHAANKLEKADSLARKVSSAQTIHAVVRIAETDPAMTIDAEELDGGRRLVLAGEVDAGKRWNEAKLKAISGGDRISARFVTARFRFFHVGLDDRRPDLAERGDRTLHRHVFCGERPDDERVDASPAQRDHMRGDLPSGARQGQRVHMPIADQR
jgi:D5 N terminal like